MSSTIGYEKSKRKALLDGVLFEIFFDAKGKLRNQIKKGYFNEVFELQAYADLKDSFDFIAEVLTAAGGNFYAVPGKGHDLAVTVSTTVKSGEALIGAIYIGGVNVLRTEEDEWESVVGVTNLSTISANRLNDLLSEQLVVPVRCLKVTYTPALVGPESALQIPSGWTVRKG